MTGDNISMGGYISAGGNEIYVCVFAKSNYPFCPPKHGERTDIQSS